MSMMVSICCTAYNQEEYVSLAIESFLMQKTNFEFEILIHDDASNDRTAEIIRYYAEQYPKKVKPVYQQENQYSKGVLIDDVFNFPRAKGIYIALCEGDDFWTDPYKLQKQVDFMEAHPECRLSMHAVLKINAKGDKLLGHHKVSKENRYYSTEEVICGEDLFATNSMVFLKEDVKQMPDFYLTAPVGDYPLTIWLSLKGRVHYMTDEMGAYRVAAKNSWTVQVMQNPQRKKDHYRQIEKMLHNVDDYTKKRYTTAIQKHIFENEFFLMHSNYDLKRMKTEKYCELYDQLSQLKKIKLYIGCYFPLVLRLKKHWGIKKIIPF